MQGDFKIHSQGQCHFKPICRYVLLENEHKQRA